MFGLSAQSAFGTASVEVDYSIRERSADWRMSAICLVFIPVYQKLTAISSEVIQLHAAKPCGIVLRYPARRHRRCVVGKACMVAIIQACNARF